MLLISPLSAYSVQIGALAPGFSLADLSGDTVSLELVKGKVVFLNFWAPWCFPCKDELPALEKLYVKYRREGLLVIGISVDTADTGIRKFMQKSPVTFPMLIDRESAVGDHYGIRSLPSGFLIGRDGIVRYKHLGFGKEHISMYEKEIVELLNKY